jgi:hypothetical protein
MQGGFQTALLNRERNRQQLAEVLEEGYAAEARAGKIRGFLVLAVGLAAAIYLLRGGMETIDRLHKAQKGKSSSLEILAKVKKQLQERDQLLIGADGSSEFQDPEEKQRSRGEAPSYADQRIPMNLYGDLSSRRLASVENRGEYRLPSLPQMKKTEEIRSRLARAPKVAEGIYRPGVSRDLPKLAPLRRPLIAPPGTSDYRSTVAPPIRLADDSGAFPVSN